jgi:hypothetical protein
MKYDGLYFNLPDEEYHAAPGLSASGVKNLLISLPDFWERSWMNPDKPDEESEARMIGRAYHERILYGKEFFYNKYAAKFSAPENTLRTVDDLKEALVLRNLSTSGKKEALIHRLHDYDPTLPVYDELKQDYEAENAGKIFLNPSLINDIEIAAAMIEKNPVTAPCFRNGYAEVSIFWTDATGIPMKARLDYMKQRAITDLKSFDNKGRSVDRAVHAAIASYKYHIQTAFYKCEAWPAAVAAIKAGKVYGCDDKTFLDGLAATESPGFYFVFQQKGVAPLARLYKFGEGAAHTLYLGNAQIADAKQKFREAYERFGEERWIDVCDAQELDDSAFPAYISDI